MVNSGFVYILVSKNCPSIKIGGTGYPPIKRIKEVNYTEPYKSLGPWRLADFRQVYDWRKVESYLHYRFRDYSESNILNQKELFQISPKQASDALNALDPIQIIRKPKVDRMFQDIFLRQYLMTLMSWSGLTHWLDYQGIWTLNLFLSTNGGRYFTLNIGSHEVAFSTLDNKKRISQHVIIVDRLILDFVEVRHWLRQHNGNIEPSYYQTALPRATSVYFEGDLALAQTFLSLTGVRRAMIAYWHEALYELKDSDKLSAYARHHNYNAVAKLVAQLP